MATPVTSKLSARLRTVRKPFAAAPLGTHHYLMVLVVSELAALYGLRRVFARHHGG